MTCGNARSGGSGGGPGGRATAGAVGDYEPAEGPRGVERVGDSEPAVQLEKAHPNRGLRHAQFVRGQLAAAGAAVRGKDLELAQRWGLSARDHGGMLGPYRAARPEEAGSGARADPGDCRGLAQWC